MNNDSTQQFLKPANPDVLVRNPERGGHLALEGEVVPKNSYWHRRLADGDVVAAKPVKPTKEKK
ncbi:MAG: DUF2635 domain-containing protein [Methylophaga sp.]|nr:DUF2635 domain-containing protein [Methylophaga sp.]